MVCPSRYYALEVRKTRDIRPQNLSFFPSQYLRQKGGDKERGSGVSGIEEEICSWGPYPC